MSIIRVDQVYLYTGLSATGADQYAAWQWLKENGIDFTFMQYGEPETHQGVFDSLNTWDGAKDKKLDQFPIVHYRVVDEDFTSQVVFLNGLDEIRGSLLPTLINQYGKK